MIKNLSPYYLTIPFVAPLSGLTCTEFTLQIFVWDGAKSSPPTSAVYETTIKNPTASVGNSKFDIANLVSDAIIFTQQEGTGTQLINGNNQVWVKWRTFYKTTLASDNTTATNINTELSVKGYAYGFDGENQSTPTNKILLTADDFKVSRNSFFVLPIEIAETTVVLGTLVIQSIAVDTHPIYDLDWSSTGNLGDIYYRFRLDGTTTWALGLETVVNDPQEIELDVAAGTYNVQLQAYDNDNSVVIFSNIYNIVVA
jgi:hypothetical protein